MHASKRMTAALVLVTLLLSACGSAPQATTAPTAVPEQVAPTTAAAGEEPTTVTTIDPTTAPVSDATGVKTTISFWFNPPEEGEAADCFVTNAIDKFNATSTTTMVEAIPQPNAWDATRTALAGGAGPDVITTPGPSFAFELVQAGQLLPLDEYVEQLQWSDRFVPWALNLGKVDGKLYSIPNELETLVLYYNKTLFEEKGWQPPKTIDELMTLGEKIKAEGIIPFGHANAEWRPANEWFVGEFLNKVAGPDKVYEALKGTRPWTDPEFVRAIEVLNTMQQKGWFMGGLERYYTATFDEAHAALGNGEAAMNIEGTWFLNDISTVFGEAAGNSNDWGWVPVPSTSGDAIFNLGIGSTYSINKATKNPQAVVAFIDYVFSADVQGTLVAECNSAPAPIRLEADALAGIDPRKAEIFEALGTASDQNNYGYTTWTFWPPKSDTYIYEEVEKVWANTVTSQEYLEGLQKIFGEELKAGDIPPLPTR